MSFVKYALPALAVAASAAAQSSSVNPCSTSATVTIQNGGDATALASCTTYTGSIALATGVTGSISFDGIKDITGDFSAVNAVGITTLGGAALTTIGGTMTLQNLTVLTGLNFPDLTNVGSVDWLTLPNLQGLGTNISTTSSLNIQDTQLATLSGINLTTAATINIANNKYLTTIDMELTSITNMLTLASNGNGDVAASFPQLVGANGLSFSNINSLGLGALQYVNQTLAVVNNGLTTISCPNLTTVGGLTFQTNAELSSISLPVLATCSAGALVINGNNALTGNISFPELTKVIGAINVTGAYTALSVPLLNEVDGATYLVSSANIASTCNTFTTYGGDGVLRGGATTLTCDSGSGTSSSGSTTASGSATGTASAAASTSTAAKKSSAGRFESSSGSVFGLFGLVAAAFALL